MGLKCDRGNSGGRLTAPETKFDWTSRREKQSSGARAPNELPPRWLRRSRWRSEGEREGHETKWPSGVIVLVNLLVKCGGSDKAQTLVDAVCGRHDGRRV